MPEHAKIPATVITGFLGAGKTSMIRHLLATAEGRRLALIINEFGDLGIDGDIVKSCGLPDCTDENVIELANGCICCTVADDFLPTMQALMQRDEPPDHIVIETSGLALPKPLVKAFTWPEVRTRLTVDGVIALVDTPAVAAGRFAGDPEAVTAQRQADPALDHDSPLEELFEEQLLAADLVVLNKTDLVAPEELRQVREMVERNLRPGVKLVTAVSGGIDAAVLLGLGMAAEDDLDARPSHHDGDVDHEHDEFESFVVELDEIDDPHALVASLQEAVRRHDILRVKGFAAVAGKGMRLVVQGVGERIQTYFDRDWHADEQRRSRLVLIGLAGMDRATIVEALAG